jgi:lauroyl/myristoyl acyltransferase
MLSMRARTAAQIIARLSPREADLLAHLLSPLLPLIGPGRHRAWRENVASLGPDTGRPHSLGPHRAHLLTLYECFALLSGREFSIRLEGQHHLESARAAGGGVLLVTAHVGNWVVAGSGLARLGSTPVHSVAGVQVLRCWTAEIRSALRAHGIRIHDSRKRGSSFRLLRILRRGGVVALHLDGDRHAVAGVAVRGAGILARRAGVMILPATCTREGIGRHVLAFQTPRSPEGFTPQAADDLLRALARPHAEQWTIFRPLWGAA